MNENVLKADQIDKIKICGKSLSEALEIVCQNLKVGVSTKKLDEIAEKEIRKRGCVPSFLNYYVEGSGNYPASLCVSINDEIVHGIPSEDRIIQDGDLVSLDLGAGYEGIYSDMAITLVAGKSTPKQDQLIDVTKKALEVGISNAVIGNTIGDIGAMIEEFVLDHGFEVIRDYVGHGIGTKPHLWPQIPNFGRPGTGAKLVDNMALAIEPMVTTGDFATRVMEDRWTVTTKSGALAAHFEHTILITEDGPLIVTKV